MRSLGRQLDTTPATVQGRFVHSRIARPHERQVDRTLGMHRTGE